MDLEALVDSLLAQGLRTPLILRFPDILGDRIATLNVSCGVVAGLKFTWSYIFEQKGLLNSI